MKSNTIFNDIKLFVPSMTTLLCVIPFIRQHLALTGVEMIPRYKYCFSLLICVLLLISTVNGSAIKDALEEHLKDISHDEGQESIKHDKQKGEKIHQEERQTNDNHKNQYSKANDEAKYLKKDHDTKSASESDAYKGYAAQQDKAEDSQTTGYKRGHKKGHHKQGFQNSYHKDESSNKSTFFDDLNDEGDQAAYNSKLNSHDNHGGRSYQGSHNNGQEYVRDNYNGGGYNRYGDSGVKNHGHQDYGKKYYLDDNLNHNKYRNNHNNYARDHVRDHHEYQAPHPQPQPGWDWQRWDDNRRGWERPGWQADPGWRADPGWKADPGWAREPDWQRDPGWERDYGGPGYYDDRGFRHEGGYGYGPNHGYGYGYGESRANPVAEVPQNAPVVAHRKQTITIYEDPRYDGKDTGQLRKEEGDYLQLDFKPSTHRYATYDDTYYNAPVTRGGAVEASKINRLVYNYRRQ
ncbi:unnamed protein product [Chrysodeixis includens]|uniref:Uncharacterized protein n=1 Tax=Chrysodeixis includens TaxID=689277 RepID=A0A9P0FY44_CHRIL|nr:unnamed protein product [Chrysodeixis includens]